MEKRVEFRLSMPSNNAWNGRWTGAGRNYTIVARMSDTSCRKLFNGDDAPRWYHNFGDGWTACISARVVPTGERLQKSDGFCGYNWMVSDIRAYGNIGGPKENSGTVAPQQATAALQNSAVE